MHREKGSIPYSFDEDYMKRVSKADFLKGHKHLDEVIDLEAEWEKHNPGKDKDKPKSQVS